MTKLYVGFSKSKKKFPIFSWIVQLYERKPYSHIYLRLDTKNKFTSDKFLHAAEGKVQNMSGTQFHKRNEIVYEYSIAVDPNLYRLIINALHEASGDDYGFMQNIGIVLADFLELFGKKIKNPWQKGFNCSEFAMYILKKIYPENFVNYDKNLIKPSDLEKELECLLDKSRVDKVIDNTKE
jgi:hypothetical protein